MKHNKLNFLTHVTRKEGEITEISRELVLTGPVTVSVNGEVIGVADGDRVDIPLWQKGVSDKPQIDDYGSDE